jgi:hypothetical protein
MSGSTIDRTGTNRVTLGSARYPTALTVADGPITPDVVREPAPCFTTGTRILTTRGEVPVEELCIGDSIIRHDGTRATAANSGSRSRY